jgi:hypothetical protein
MEATPTKAEVKKAAEFEKEAPAGYKWDDTDEQGKQKLTRLTYTITWNYKAADGAAASTTTSVAW